MRLVSPAMPVQKRKGDNKRGRQLTEDEPGRKPPTIAYIVMAFTPLFFSTNLIFGRSAIGEVAPFTLAFLRWLAVALVLAPMTWTARERIAGMSRHGHRHILLLGFLGMWICGAMVYVGLQYTTATNATLLYTTSSVMIIMLEGMFYGRASGWREAAGIVLALAGVVVIVVKGSLAVLTALAFNAGDLIILAAAIAWAWYSVLQRHGEVATLPNLAAFGLVSATGALLLAPFAVSEYLAGAPMPKSALAWQSLGGIILFASLLAFSAFQYGVRRLGPSLAGIFMYAMPVYGVALAAIFLGEAVKPYHLTGAALVIGGVVTVTLPTRIGSAKRAKRREGLEQEIGHRLHAAGQEEHAGDDQQAAHDLLDPAHMHPEAGKEAHEGAGKN